MKKFTELIGRPDEGFERLFKRPFSEIGGYGVALAVGVAFAIMLSRAPQAFSQPQLWAEDGRIFLVQQRLYGLDALLIPVAGYLCLIPRLIAFLVSPFGATYAPELYMTGWVLATLWSVATIAAARLPYAWLFAIALLLVPHGGEVFGNITNVQWVMAPALALILASPAPKGRFARLNQIVFTLMTGLTGPFAILALPLCGLRLFVSRSFFDMALVGVCVLAAVIQITVIVAAGIPSMTPSPQRDPVLLSAILLVRWIGQFINGAPWVETLIHDRQGAGRTISSLTISDLRHAGRWGLFLLTFATMSAGLFLKKTRFFSLCLLVFSMLILTATWFKFHDAFFGLLAHPMNGDRYFVVPRVATIWIFLHLLLQFDMTAILAAAMLSAVIVHHREWRKQDLPVLEWRAEAWKIDRGDPVHIVINPSMPGRDQAWSVTLPSLRRTTEPEVR